MLEWLLLWNRTEIVFVDPLQKCRLFGGQIVTSALLYTNIKQQLTLLVKSHLGRTSLLLNVLFINSEERVGELD